MFHRHSGFFCDLVVDLQLRLQRHNAWQAGGVLNQKNKQKKNNKNNFQELRDVQSPFTCHLFRKCITSMKVFLMSQCRFSGLYSSSRCTVKLSSSPSQPAYDADSDMNAASKNKPRHSLNRAIAGPWHIPRPR